MDKILKKYYELILKTQPSKLWKSVRLILHWITIPLKLFIIGGLGLFQILSKSFKKTRVSLNNNVTISTKRLYFKEVFDNLPLLKTTELESYVNRVPYYTYPNGYNHNSDHHTSRHSTYQFLMNKLGLNNDKIMKTTNMFMQGKYLCRGFVWNPYEDRIDYNVNSVSGDMLCGLNLAILSNSNPNENFDHLVTSIIDNDYALLEGALPRDFGYDMYSKLLKEASFRPEKVAMKSSRAMWQPGLETVGAQALTILATLRVAEIKNGNREAGKEYRKLLFKYGYGLLSLFPTAYIDKQRGYFNDHNCMIALYVLSKCSKSKLGKFFWKIPMLYTWALSKHWYNGYFTGLVKECYPDSINEKYIKKCINYLYENKPNTFSYDDRVETVTNEQPVTYNDNVNDEFSPDIRHDLISRPRNDDALKIKTGLGFIACAIMLEKEPKDLL